MVELLAEYGLYGIFILAVVEAVFLPVPVETLLIPFLIVNPRNWLLAVIVSTIGSVIGAAIGNRVGCFGERYLISKVISEKKIELTKKYFNLCNKRTTWS